MVYRSSNQFFDDRIGATLFSVIPASAGSSIVGTALLAGTTGIFAIADGELPVGSVGDMLMILMAGGLALALGSIAGFLVVAFYLVVFGFPVAFVLGNKLRTPFGQFATVGSVLVGSAVAYSWLAGSLYYDPSGTDATGPAFHWAALFSVATFALPASYLYRRSVIMTLDELA